jgi:hypothetical protein
LPVRGKARLDHLRLAEVGTSDQRNHGVVGTGGAVRPLYPLLVRARLLVTDPTIAPAFDGLKISVSRRVSFIDCSLLRSSFPGPRNEGFNRCLSPPGFPQCPTVRELRGALAPSTEMSRMTIYLAGLLEGDGRASHLAPNTDHLGGTADAHGARLTARRPVRAASVRSTSDSDRTGASERTDVKCQQLTHALQQTAWSLDHLIGE